MTDRVLEIPSLDGLRAFSIIVVFVAHAGAGNVIPGGFGVTVFFALSGYLITTLLRLEFERSKVISVQGFYIRRIFRILPLFYVVLTSVLLATLSLGLGTGTVDSGATLAEYGHITNYWSIFVPTRPVMEGTGVYWSLAVEEHFYLLFPLLFVVFQKLKIPYRRQALALAAICVVVLVWRTILVYGYHVVETRTYYSTDTRVDSILAGCIMALAFNPMLDPVPDKRILGRWAAIGALVILLTLFIRDVQFRESIRYTLQSASIVAIMVYVIAAPRGVIGRVLNFRTLIWIGKISFGLYLVHQVILFEVGKHVGTLQTAVIAAVLSLLVATVLYRVIEQPALGMRKRVMARRSSAPSRARVRDDQVVATDQV